MGSVIAAIAGVGSGDLVAAAGLEAGAGVGVGVAALAVSCSDCCDGATLRA